MIKISLPYGRKKLIVEIQPERVAGWLESQKYHVSSKETQEDIVKKAMYEPIASQRLCELVKDRKKIVIISSDHTRPVPSKITMPIILDEIEAGNAKADVTILVATGFHRLTTKNELKEKYGEEIVKNVEIVVHDSNDSKNMLKVGVLPSGGDLILNRLAIEADLLVAEGFIEPHFFAGFSGGRKSILPGIASRTTVMANHCSEFIAHSNSRTGCLEGNPIHKDMLFAADVAKLAYILNVILDSNKEIIKAFAGHHNEAHLQGCRFVQDYSLVNACPADIVITTNGGYPLDQNIYQTVKGMTAAEATCSEKGVIIAVSQCEDGHGGHDFYKTFAESASVSDIMDSILQRTTEMTIPDQWESQILARILLKYHVIMVTDAPRSMVESMKMMWAASVEEAILMAEKIIGKTQAKITVIPDGVSVIVNKN